MKFDYTAPNWIIFGNGTLNKVGEIAPELGRRALIVTGSGSVPLESLFQILNHVNVAAEVFRIHHEPDIPTIEAGLSMAKSASCDFVIGFGGGSSLDGAKAIAAMMTNPGDLLDYLEVVGKGKGIPNQAASMIALPTTAGPGTEVTRNAVIISPEHHVKVSMRSPKMIPTVAIIDPELTYTMPPSVTASTGMDALTQLIEAYVSIGANVMTDVIAREGIRRGARSLLTAYKEGLNRAAREDMALTSLFGGLTLANAGLGAVHGFAGVIGGMFNAPHGVICACLLPHVMKYNVEVCQHHERSNALLGKYQDIAKLLTGRPDALIEDGLECVSAMAHALDIPRLSTLGVKQSDFRVIIEKTVVSSSMQKNPVKLSEEILSAILNEAY